MENRIQENGDNNSDRNWKTDRNGFVQVYTAGSCLKNGLPGAHAGVGVWFGEGHPLNVSEEIRHRHTSHCAQIEAYTRAIQVAHSAGIKKICINAFYQFAIDFVCNHQTNDCWIKYDGELVKTKIVLVELETSIQLMDEVKWNKVPRYAGLKEVEAAYNLAYRAASQRKLK